MKNIEYKEIPLEEGQKLVRVEGKWLLAQDIGCPSYEDARVSRANQHSTDSWWEAMEHARDTAARNKPLPESVPEGDGWLPKAGKKRPREEGRDGND